jgi:acetyl esterase/lipase
MARHLRKICVTALVIIMNASPSQARQRAPKPPPTHKDVRYGPHERNVLDFWQARTKTPAPQVVYIHGGGFRNGSKASLKANDLTELLDAGISVAALHYRLIQQKRLPAAHHDCARALRFLRSKAKAWNLDKQRVGAFGGSAGAQLSMWLAFHDEMADPKSSDPIATESTRLTCVATIGGQTTMDFKLWQKWIPGYDKPHRDPYEMLDAGNEDELRKVVEEISALSLISKDDPPIHMYYRMAPDDPVPSDPAEARSWQVHHVVFGEKLKEKMDRLGIEADLRYPGAKPIYTSIPRFFEAKLQQDKR